MTAIVRDPARYSAPDASVKVIKGDALDAASISTSTSGSDVVINTISPNRDGDPQILVKAAGNCIAFLG